MKVVITGGNGFIGAWTARVLLEGGHTVRIFDVHDDQTLFDQILGTVATSGIERQVGDIADERAVDAAVKGCEAVVHLAGILIPGCRKDPMLGARVNVFGTLNVFESAKRHGIRGIAYASSAAVFGPDDGVHPAPVTHYGAYKLCNEGCARAYWEDAQIPSVGFRPLTVYGLGRTVGVTAGPTLAMAAATRGEAYTIPFTGSTTMDYVEDTAALFARAATQTPPGAHISGIGGPVASTGDIIAAIRTIVPSAKIDAQGAPLPVAAKIDEGDLTTIFPTPPRTSLLDGTRKTIDQHRALQH